MACIYAGLIVYIATQDLSRDFDEIMEDLDGTLNDFDDEWV